MTKKREKRRFAKKSRRLQAADSCSLKLICILALLFVLGGCARLPYGSAILGDERTKREADWARFTAAAAECTPCFDGEFTVNWSQTMNSISFSGYFQARPPSYLRFSVLNPFGQPLYAVSGNGTHFQSVDTTRRLFTAGSLSSLSLHKDIPLAFLAGPLGTWLSGQPSVQYILEVHDDPDNRGTWYSLTDTLEEGSAKELVLLDRSASKILKRVVISSAGNISANIDYGNWQMVDGCEQPHELRISGLSYRAEALVKLSDVRTADITAESFLIEPPANYKRRLLP